MLEVSNSIEFSRLSLVIGAFIAIKYKDRYGVIPGGIIVPGFIITLLLISPLWCCTVLGLSFPVFWIYKNFLNRTDYKRRTPMYILAFISIAIANLTAILYSYWGWFSVSFDSLSGTMLPAIIAFTFTKQKVPRVITGIIVSTLLTLTIVMFVYLIGSNLLGWNFNYLNSLTIGKEIFTINNSLIQFYTALGIGYLFYHFQDIRVGGYLIAPVVAALFVQPISAIFFIGGCLLIYYATQKICQYTLLIGLNRYTLVLLLSTVYIWAIEIIFSLLDSTILPFQGSNIFVIIAMLSYVNDVILHSRKNIIKFIFVTLVVSATTLITIDFLNLLFV